MPIQILQPEFIRPIYSGTWAGKPSATGNAGKEIIVTDFNRSRWASNGTYWYPVGGYAVLKRKNLQSITGAYPALAEVPNAFDGFIIPDDLLLSPGAPTFEGRAYARRNGTLGTAQSYRLEIGFDGTAANLGFIEGTAGATQAAIRTFGQLIQANSAGDYHYVNTSSASDAQASVVSGVAFATFSGSPVKLFARNGATDGSESWAFNYCSLAIHLAG